MKNYSIARRITLVVIFLAVGAFLVLANKAARERAFQRGLELASYEALPSAEKIATSSEMRRIVAEARRGDFLVFKNGTAYFVVRDAEIHNGRLTVYLRRSMDSGNFPNMFEPWEFRAVVGSFVKKTNPEAAAIALKFLSQ